MTNTPTQPDVEVEYKHKHWRNKIGDLIFYRGYVYQKNMEAGKNKGWLIDKQELIDFIDNHVISQAHKAGRKEVLDYLEKNVHGGGNIRRIISQLRDE